MSGHFTSAMTLREYVEDALDLADQIYYGLPVRDETREAHFALEQLRRLLRVLEDQDLSLPP